MYVKILLCTCSCFTVMLILQGTDAGRMFCPQGWTHFDHSCYLSFLDNEFKLPWIDAYEKCASLQSHLLVLNSQQETEFITSIIRQFFPSSDAYKRIWLGCKEIDEKHMCYENYRDELATIEARCVYFDAFTTESGDSPCFGDFGLKRFICEKPLKLQVRCLAVSNQDAGLMTTPYCLLDHAYMVTQIKHPIQCCIACYEDPNCRSFNLSGKMCHLNNVTISQVDASKYVTTTNDCAYYRLD